MKPFSDSGLGLQESQNSSPHPPIPEGAIFTISYASEQMFQFEYFIYMEYILSM